MWLYANLSNSSISCNLRAKSRTEQIHCQKTSLGSTILGAALAKIDCVTYCFKYLAKFVDQVDLCTGLEVGIPDSNQAGQVLLGVFGRLRYSHQKAPLTSREIIVYCQTVKEA